MLISSSEDIWNSDSLNCENWRMINLILRLSGCFESANAGQIYGDTQFHWFSQQVRIAFCKKQRESIAPSSSPNTQMWIKVSFTSKKIAWVLLIAFKFNFNGRFHSLKNTILTRNSFLKYFPGWILLALAGKFCQDFLSIVNLNFQIQIYWSQ